MLTSWHLSAQLGLHLTVHGHHTCLYEVVGLAAATNTSIGQELVQTDRLVGVEVLFLIFNTFLQ